MLALFRSEIMRIGSETTHFVTPKPSVRGEGLDKGGWACGEGLEDVPTLLSRGGYDGAEAGEGPRAGHCSEAAGDFHLDLHHPQILLGLIVGEGDGEVVEESQHIGFELVQPDEEIVSRAMRRPSAGSDRSGEGRLISMEGESAPDD